MKRYPCVLQDDPSSCGVACLATVAQRFGDRPSWHHLREATGTMVDGANLAGLSGAAQAMGYLTWAVTASPEALSNLPTPFVAHVVRDGSGHFVVVHEVRNTLLIVADPAEGLSKRARKDFLDIWTGKVLLLTRHHGLPSAMESQGLMGRILGLIAPHRWLLFETLIASVLTTGLAYGTALLFSNLIDRVFPSGDVWTLHLFGALALVLALITGLFTLINSLLVVTIGQRVSVHLMFPTLQRLLKLPVSYFESRRTGDVLHRFSTLIALKGILTSGPVTVVLDGLVLLMTGTILFLYHWQLALAVMGVLPIMALTTLLIRIPLRKAHADALVTGGKLESQLVSMMSGYATVKSYGAEDMMAQRAEPSMGRLIRLTARMETIALVPRVVNRVFAGVSIALVYWLGGSMVMQGDLTLGQMIFCITIAGSLFPPFLSLLNMILGVQHGLASLERATDIVDADPEKLPAKGLVPPRGIQGEVRLEGVTFRYGKEVETLKDVSFRVEPGDILALVGESGSGKSTLLKLMNRLYLPESGRILIDGVDVRDFDVTRLRESVALVDQECRTFAGSIAENLQMAGKDVPMKDLIGAARLVGLGRFIEKLPARYDTEVGEGGARLSGGERQRLAIARAVARRPQILLLDEVTAHLDPSMERELFSRLKLALKGSTIILATHRIALAQACDKVVVMKKGQVEEAGRPKQLLSSGGLFAQFSGKSREDAQA